MVGIRLIVDQPLPTQKYFEFKEPSAMALIAANNRCEFGRFIIIPPDEVIGDYLPRGLVMLFLLDTVSVFGTKNNFFGGYSFIKKSLDAKFKKMKIPIGRIRFYKQNYPKEGVLYNYFTQAQDHVIPIYFLTKDFLAYSEKIIHNSRMFENKGEGVFILKLNLYTKFLRLLKII